MATDDDAEVWRLLFDEEPPTMGAPPSLEEMRDIFDPEAQRSLREWLWPPKKDAEILPFAPASKKRRRHRPDHESRPL